MVESTRLAVVVLAAGLSRRFGIANKLLAPLEGQPLASHIAQTLDAMKFAQRIVVCGDSPETASIFLAHGFSVITNPDSSRGQGSSLALGIAAAEQAGASAALVCLADMPRVSIGHLRGVAGALSSTPSGIVASASEPGRLPSPPAAFAARHFEALQALTGDRGARALLSDALLVVAPQGELNDFDLPSDFAASA